MFNSKQMQDLKNIKLTETGRASLEKISTFTPGLYWFCGKDSLTTYGEQAAVPGVFTLMTYIMTSDSVACSMLDLKQKASDKDTSDKKRSFPYKDADGHTVLGQVYAIKAPENRYETKDKETGVLATASLLQTLLGRKEILTAPVLVFSCGLPETAAENVHMIY